MIWQIAAEEPAAIPDQFTALATELGSEPATDPEALQARVHNRLRERRGWLLIFDNADTVEGIRPWLPGGPVPAGSRGHVIVTTRRGGFGALARVMDLDVIDLPDAVALLRSRLSDLDLAIGEQIAEELGKLPLALEQAAAYLDRTKMPGEEYLELLRNRAADLYQRRQVASRTDMVGSLWRISLDSIADESPAATQLLEICAFLAPEPIPLDLFTEHPDSLPRALASASRDQIDFADVMAVLIDYSLAKRIGAGLQIHRLVQAAVRLRRDGPALGAKRGLSADHPLVVALALLSADAPLRITDDPQAWPRWATLFPHVLAATAHLDDPAAQPSPSMLANTSWLLDRAAIYLRVRGRSGAARPLLERALLIAETADEPDRTAIDACLNNLAQILRDLGDLGGARSLQERALAIDEAAYGPDHPDVAINLNNLAQILQDLGDLGGAQSLQERALAIGEVVHGPDHPAVALRLNNLALILRDLGDLGGARPLQERALAIDEAAYGPNHPEVAIDLNNLALILRDLGEADATRRLQERAQAVEKAVRKRAEGRAGD